MQPYSTLLELADDLDVTLPHLKRRLRELEARDELTLENLVGAVGGKNTPPDRDDLFLTFHRRDLCLVCGSEMQKVSGRQAGWGEFQQCPFCLFSAHENADYQRLRQVAGAKLDELDAAFREANRIFTQRTKRGAELKAEAEVPVKRDWKPH